MNTKEKIQDVLEYKCWSRYERKMAAEYVWALYRNKEDVIAEYEKFGKTPRHIFMNRHAYECGLKFGFTYFAIDENGWIIKPKFLNTEEVGFTYKSQSYSMNEVRLGMGVNGKWTYAISYSTGNAGGGSGISVYDPVIESREEALIAGLKEILERHASAKASAEKYGDSCLNYKADYCNAIVKQVQDMLDELTGKKRVQMNLFDML